MTTSGSPGDILDSISIEPPPPLAAARPQPVGRYLLGLVVIAALVIASTFLTYASLSQQRGDTALIETAATQVRLAGEVAATLPPDVAALVAELEANQLALQFGDDGRGIPATTSDAVDAMLITAAGPHAALIAALDTAAAGEPGPEVAAAARAFVTPMSSLEFQLRSEAEERIEALQQQQYVLLSVILVLLILEGIFLFRPLTARVRDRWLRRDETLHREHVLDQKRLSYLARYDPLTGLINRTLFADRLQSAVARARRDGGLVALMFLDMDDFKTVNDRYGHAVGDALLRQVAERLVGSVRESDTVARLGGDEFTVILEGGHRVEDAGRVATKILAALAQPYRLGQREIVVTSSIGIATYPIDGDDADSLLRDADVAMYSAKAAGRNTYQYFTKELRERTSERIALIDGLRRALDDGSQLELVYQPKVDIEQRLVIGFEALLRWNHPELGRVLPSRFVPLAEETDLILPIGEWVLDTACAQMKDWRRNGLPDLSVAVNVSPRQFRMGNVVETVATSLAAAGLSPRFLEIELTEATLVADAEMARRGIERLRDMGVRVSVDDFGTGYTSLRYLSQLPIDALKIDRSFVRDIDASGNGAAISSAVLGMARSLHMDVVAEGVETVDQVDVLRSLGCTRMQGFLFSRPLPASEVPRFVAEFQSEGHSLAV